jgi:hypothetical protein
LEMTSNEKHETPASIDETFHFKTAAFVPKPKEGERYEIDLLKEEIEYLRQLNEENVVAGQKLKEKLKVQYTFLFFILLYY